MSRDKLPLLLGICFASFLCFSQTGICDAQTPPPGCKYVLDQLPAPGDPNLETALKSFTDIGGAPECFWQLASHGAALPPSILRGAYTAQKKVNTTHTGAPSGSAGTTSAVSKPVTPLSLATEYGGITSSANAQTVTLQAPLDGIPRALATHGWVPYCTTPLIAIPGCESRKTLDFLSRFGFGVSMNTATPSTSTNGTTMGNAQGSTQPVSLTSLGNQSPTLAGAFVKVTLLKGAPSLPDIKKIDTSYAHAQSAAAAQLLGYLAGNEAYADWQRCVQDKLRLAKTKDRISIFNQYYVQVVSILLTGAKVDCSDGAAPKVTLEVGQTYTPEQAKLNSALQAYIAAVDLTQANFDAEVNSASAAPVLSFEYDVNTPANQPSNSVFKFIGSVGWPTPKGPSASSATAPWTLTYNLGVSIYNSTPDSTIPEASLLRDVQFGTELDRNINSSKWPGLLGKIGDTTASLTYYFQYQSSPSILNVTPGSPLPGLTITGLSPSAKQVFASKGTINVVQLKYALGKGTNAKFPIAVTYSNRSELIVHPTWGVQFGVTYDLSALMGTGSNK